MHTGFGYRGSGPAPGVLMKTARYEVLERAAEGLEIPDSLAAEAETHYEAVGGWLNKSDHPALRRSEIFAHGSAAIHTTVRHPKKSEHDIDLMCLMPGLGPETSSNDVKALVGQRLRDHGIYRTMLQEKNRCWRLHYANQFHLDITPAIPNPSCSNGGLLVPDKELKGWKPSHPVAYRNLFNRRASLGPSFASDGRLVIRADVEPLPEQKGAKGVLRCTVQLQKRHRDLWFPRNAPDHATISIIITTLAMRSYEMCLGRLSYDNPLDLMADTVAYMPLYVEEAIEGGRRIVLVRNETTDGENFADKWNGDVRFRESFKRWNKVAAADFRRLADIEGLDALHAEMSSFLGDDIVQKVWADMNNAVGERRRTGTLAVTRNTGLAAVGTAGATQVRPNTHFGR